MKLINVKRSELPSYVHRQLTNLLPTEEDPDLRLIKTHMNTALDRVERCLSGIRVYTPGQFDIMHSSQYCTFLYYLANSIWRLERRADICTRLCLLNKILNGFDCFYEVELPEVFLVGHTVGVVLAKDVTYGNFLALHQNCTIGKNHQIAPVIGDRVVLYPNSAIIGRCRIGSGTVVSQGLSIINRDTPGDSAAFGSKAGDLVFRPLTRNVAADIFNL